MAVQRVLRPPRGAYLPAFSAMVVMQALHDRLPQTIQQLERNPNADSAYARELRNTWADLKAAGQEFQSWHAALPSVTSAEVQLEQAGSDWLRSHPPMGTGWAAERLNRSERWVRTLIASGRLAAVKQGGRWFVDPASVGIYLEATKEAA
jgi:uncharacterized protein (UPF0261 family)